jgi:hypothetical protein
MVGENKKNKNKKG